MRFVFEKYPLVAYAAVIACLCVFGIVKFSLAQSANEIYKVDGVIKMYEGMSSYRFSTVALSDNLIMLAHACNPEHVRPYSYICAKIVDTQGKTIKDDFITGNSMYGYEGDSYIAALAGGGAVVVWYGRTSLTSTDYGIFGYRFDEDGNHVGGAFRVNTTTDGPPLRPKVTGLPNGNFVVTWFSGFYNNDVKVFAQLFDGEGNKISDEIKVNTYVDDYLDTTVTYTADSGFFVAWMSPGQGVWDIRGRVFDSAGLALGSEFLVNTHTTGGQIYPQAVHLSNNNIVVVWESYGQDGFYAGKNLYAQLFDESGSKIGGEFIIADDNNSVADGYRYYEASALPEGGFVVAWDFNKREYQNNIHSIRAQVFDNGGNAVGERLYLNSDTSIITTFPEALYFSDNTFMIMWISRRGDDAVYDLYGQQLSFSPDNIPAPPAHTSVIYQKAYNQNHIAWEPVGNAQTYTLYWNTAGGVSQSDNRVSGISQPYHYHQHLAPGTCYHYRLASANSSGESILADEQSVCTPAVLTAELGYFVFADIASPQSVKTPFSVTITARSNLGDVFAYNGGASLYSSAGAVKPGYITFADGVWQEEVEVYDGGTGVSLKISAKEGRSGASNEFAVVSGLGNTGSLAGTVTDAEGNAIDGAVVTLYELSPKEGGSPVGEISAVQGSFEFSNIACGKYYIQTYHNNAESQIHEKTVPCGRTVTEDLSISYCNPDGRNPVLLLPGIMGSDTVYNPSVYPIILKDKKLKLHDPFSIVGLGFVGWSELKNNFKQIKNPYKEECTLFDVPYNWMLKSEEAASQYLEPAINRAKQISGAGKVDIVAHSMGGLVARSYIQSINYKNDVEKLALVGTPNKGSALAYYIWEGGDTKLVDELTEPWYLDIVNFYSNTANLAHWIIYKYPLCLNSPVTGIKKCSKKNTLKLAHNNILSLKQLLPIYGNALIGREIVHEENTFLKALNNKSCISGSCDYTFTPPQEVFTDVQSSDKVIVKLFGGTNKDTAQNIYVGNPSDADFYPDGEPLPEEPLKTREGDGTVLVDSVKINNILTSPEIINASHTSLIGAFIGSIINFIHPISENNILDNNNIVELDNTASSLVIGVNGRAQPYVVNPAGSGAGIHYQTLQRESAIADTEVLIDSDMGKIEIKNPIDGVYTVYLNNVYEEDYTLNISYLDENTNQEVSDTVFNKTRVRFFSFTLDAGLAQPITVDYDVLAPGELKASSLENGVITYTKLMWEPVSRTLSYNIYSKKQTEPFFSLLGNTAGSDFNTTDKWAEYDSSEIRVYAVSAVNSNGKESVFSNFAVNDGSSAVSEYCVLPENGPWTVDASCILNSNYNALEDVIVSSNALLTINPSVVLKIDLKNHKLLVKKGGGVLIKKGAVIVQK